MELYSRTPPNIAPRRLTAITLDTCDSRESRQEKIKPEKNIGHVSSSAVPMRPAAVEGSPPALATHHPPSNAARTNRCGKVAPFKCSPATSRLERNAIASTPEMATAMTCQVFP